MRNKNIVITGATGQVGFPLAVSLAEHNTVYAVARFTDESKRQKLEQAGIVCIAANLGDGDFGNIPLDADYLLNFAVNREVGNDFEAELRLNAEGLALLMQHCQRYQAVLHVSSCAVYHPAPDTVLTEDSALGDNHRNMFTTYSIGKIAQEAVVRSCARMFGLPSIICRLNVPYSSNGGWPWFHLMMMEQGISIPIPQGLGEYTLIHQDDINDSVPGLLDSASVPCTIVNWSGHEHVSIQDWCHYLGELVGLTPQFTVSPAALPSIRSDSTKMQELVGPTKVPWRDGLRRMVEHGRPDLMRQ